MKRGAGNVVGVLLVLLGLLWAGQGLNLIGGSFMTGQTQWLVIGVVVAIAGLVILVWANRRR
jgi:hypothetical protein